MIFAGREAGKLGSSGNPGSAGECWRAKWQRIARISFILTSHTK